MKGKTIFVFVMTAIILSAILWIQFVTKRKVKIISPVQVMITAPSEQKQEVRSGDGEVRLTTKVNLKENGKDYNFFVSQSATEEGVLVYSRSVGLEDIVEVPANSWSPDNRLFFILEKTNGTENYLVFRRDDSLFSGGQKYLNINDYWTSSKQKNKIREVTGWASADLLVVATTQEDGTAGRLFWFVVSSHNFMQLRQL